MSTRRGSLLLNHFVDGRVYIAHGIFFLRPDRNAVPAPIAYGFSGPFFALAVVFLRGPSVFLGPLSRFSSLPWCPQNQFSPSQLPPTGPEAPLSTPLGYQPPYRAVLVVFSLFRARFSLFFCFFTHFFTITSLLIILFVPSFHHFPDCFLILYFLNVRIVVLNRFKFIFRPFNTSVFGWVAQISIGT